MVFINIQEIDQKIKTNNKKQLGDMHIKIDRKYTTGTAGFWQKHVCIWLRMWFLTMNFQIGITLS